MLSVGVLTDNTGAHEYVLSTVPDGIVCPVTRVATIRAYRNALIVCPGIRPAGNSADNHAHPATPLAAVSLGADQIVVGRPIYQAEDPVKAVNGIVTEIEKALAHLRG